MRILKIYVPVALSRDDVWDIVRKSSGIVQATPDFVQGHVKNEAGGMIWIHYAGQDAPLLPEEISALATQFNMTPQTVVSVEVSHNEQSTDVAVQFFKSFCKIIEGCVIDDEDLNFLDVDTIHMLR